MNRLCTSRGPRGASRGTREAGLSRRRPCCRARSPGSQTSGRIRCRHSDAVGVCRVCWMVNHKTHPQCPSLTPYSNTSTARAQHMPELTISHTAMILAAVSLGFVTTPASHPHVHARPRSSHPLRPPPTHSPSLSVAVTEERCCLQAVGCKPSVVTFNTLLRACARARAWRLSVHLWRFMLDCELHPDIVSVRAWISAMHASGCWPGVLIALQQRLPRAVGKDPILQSKLCEALWSAGAPPLTPPLTPPLPSNPAKHCLPSGNNVGDKRRLFVGGLQLPRGPCVLSWACRRSAQCCVSLEAPRAALASLTFLPSPAYSDTCVSAYACRFDPQPVCHAHDAGCPRQHVARRPRRLCCR